MATNDPDNTPSNDTVKTESKEASDLVKRAFEAAAKQLGYRIKFSGSYAYLDEECPEYTKIELQKVKDSCERASKESQSPQIKDEAKEREQQQERDSSDVIGWQGQDYVNKFKPTSKPSPREKVPGTNITWLQAMGNEMANYNGATLDKFANVAFAINEFKRLQNAIGVTGGSINSTYRHEALNGNTRSDHTNSGAVIDWQNMGSPGDAFVKIAALMKSGKVKVKQLIYEAQTHKSGNPVLHISFAGDRGDLKYNQTNGAKGAWENQDGSKEKLIATIKKYGGRY